MSILTHKVGKVEVAGVEIGELNNASLNITIDIAEKTKIGDTWKEQLALGKSWNVTLSLKYNPADPVQLSLRTEFIEGTGDIAQLDVYETDTEYFRGAAIITAFNVTKAINAIDVLSITFEGNGALAKP